MFGWGWKSLLLVEKKNEKIENGVCINLLTCPYYEIRKEKGNQCVGGRGTDGQFLILSPLSPPIFSPVWGENSLFTKCGPREKTILSPIFHPSYFHSNHTDPKGIGSSLNWPQLARLIRKPSQD